MTEKRLLLVDCDSDYTKRMSEQFSGIPGMRVAGKANDGVRAMKMLESERFDVVLLDPLLPELDGISLLKAMQKMKRMPIVICISQFYTSVSVELARRYGASYYVYKPIDLKSLSFIIQECAAMMEEKRQIEEANAEIGMKNEHLRRIHAIMRELGFSAKLKGSEYIAAAVAMAVESPMLMHNLSEGIYKQLMERMHTNASCIERSMRTAIAAANADGRLQALIGETPTNKMCIRYILRVLNSQP